MPNRKKFTKTLRTPKAKVAKVKHPLLDKKQKLSPKKLPKYVEKLLAVFAPFMVPEALETLRQAMATGDVKAAEYTLKAFNILQTGSAIQINQQNNNGVPFDQPPPHRSLEAFLRERVAARNQVVDVTPDPKVIECPPSSLPSSSPQAAGSEIPASRS